MLELSQKSTNYEKTTADEHKSNRNLFPRLSLHCMPLKQNQCCAYTQYTKKQKKGQLAKTFKNKPLEKKEKKKHFTNTSVDQQRFRLQMLILDKYIQNRRPII